MAMIRSAALDAHMRAIALVTAALDDDVETLGGLVAEDCEIDATATALAYVVSFFVADAAKCRDADRDELWHDFAAKAADGIERMRSKR